MKPISPDYRFPIVWLENTIKRQLNSAKTALVDDEDYGGLSREEKIALRGKIKGYTDVLAWIENPRELEP